MADTSSTTSSALVEIAPRRSQIVLLVTILMGLTAIFGALGARLVFLQVIAHEEHLDKSRRTVGRTDAIPAYAGDLRTRDGLIVARSMTAYDVGFDPRSLNEAQIVSFVATLAEEIDLTPAERQRVMASAVAKKRAKKSYVPVARGVKPEVRDAIREEVEAEFGPKLLRKALVTDRVARRIYPRGETLCQVVGVAGRDGQGQEGVERTHASTMAPRAGTRRVITDARESLRFFRPESVEVAPVNGLDVHLTIDSRAQKILEEELALGIEKHGAEAGHAVMMDCRNGDILAMTSWPRFDPNEYSRYPKEELERRRTNRTIESLYEPGSVIKPFIAAIALELGFCNREEEIWGGGRFHRIGRRRIEDVSDHGPVKFDEVVVYSSNIGMSILGMRMGKDGMIDALNRFGLCRRTGIDLPFEAKGKHTSREKWNDIYSTVSVSFGYEVMISPIQICTALSALVNGGYLFRPRIVQRYESDGKTHYVQHKIVGRPILDSTSKVMREILHRVVREGTGQYLRMKGFQFGGKTGTADMDPLYTKKDYLSSFEAFAPVDNPELVILCQIEKPRNGKYYGGTVAGPVVARTLRRWFRVAEKPRFEKMKLRGW